jgi:hypothetical protein
LALRRATDLPCPARGRDEAGERGVLTEEQLEATLDVDSLRVVDSDARHPLLDLG